MMRQVLIVILPLSAIAMAQADTRRPGEPVVHTNWQSVGRADAPPGDRILAIDIQGDRVWVGTDGGLATYENDTWRHWTSADGLPNVAVTAIACDEATRDAWLGTFGGGLVRFTAGRFDRFDQFNSGLAGDHVYDVVVAGDVVWAATNGGVSAYHVRRGEWALHLERRADEVRGPVTALIRGADSRVLFAAEWFGRIMRLDPTTDRWSVMPGPGGPLGEPERATAAIAMTPSGTLIRVTQAAVQRREPSGAWFAQRLAPLSSGRSLVAAVAAAAGSVWVGSDDGLQVLPDDPAESIIVYRHCDAEGGSGMCATQWRDGKLLAALTLPQAMPDNRVRSIAIDGDRVWVGTEHGLVVASEPRPWSAAKERFASVKPNLVSAEPRGVTAAPAPGARADLTIRIAGARPVGRTIRLPGTDTRPAPLQSLDLAAAELAVDLANGEGVQRAGVRFEVVIGGHGYERYAWGLPEDDWPRFAFEKRVVGAVACLHPPDRYVTAAVLAAGLPVVNIAAAPASLDERLHPWIFRCPRYDAAVHRAALGYVAGNLGRSRWAVLRTPGELTALHLDTWRDAAQTGGWRPVMDAEWDGDPAVLASILTAIGDAGADAILTWTDVERSGLVLDAMRDGGMTQLVVCGDAVGHGSYTRLSASGPPEIVVTRLCAHPSPLVPADTEQAGGEGGAAIRVESPLAMLLERQSARRGGARNAVVRRDALLSLDGTNHLIHAIRAARVSQAGERPRVSLQGEREAVGVELGALESAALMHWDGRGWRRVELGRGVEHQGGGQVEGAAGRAE
jgi:hypothetical protein